jgi:hypothetical protein
MYAEDYSEEFGEFASIVMTEQDLPSPENVKEALDLYITLLQTIETVV